VKYSPPNETVEVFVEERAKDAIVRVLDRGLGVDPREFEAIFQPFYRSERTADSAEGIGIGLSVCRRLVEAMGGEIWVSARPGGGSEFAFSLPRLVEDEVRTADEEVLSAATT
jgi:signal transduction histidine kinase